MPRPRPPHVQRQTTRHGKTVWYLRVGKGPRVRLAVGPGEPGFDEAYRAAMAPRAAKAAPGRAEAGSLAWLVERYRETSAWLDLSPATRRQREAILRQILKTAGAEPIRRVTQRAVADGVARRRETPAQARHYLDTLRGLFAWAVEAHLAPVDPTRGVEPPKAAGGEGFAVWTPEDVARFEARWPLGTRARVAFDVLRYTGLRRGDAACLGRPHVRDGVISIRTQKTGERVTFRMPAPLAASLAAGPVGELTFIAGERGGPLAKESFGNEFRDWCRAAGVEKSAHGLRKLAATTMAENGATVAELEAVFGWRGGRMASLYTQTADRKRLGLAASHKLVGTPAEHPIPSPEGKVRDRG